MKPVQLPVTLLSLFLLPVFCLAEMTISEGYTPEQVRKAAGDPVGKMNQGAKEIWLYRQGNVTFEHGRVTEVGWLTKAQLEQRTRKRKERARAAAAARKREAEAAAARARKEAEQALQKKHAPRIHTYKPQFTRQPSSEAELINDVIPVEFEKIRIPKAWVQKAGMQVSLHSAKNRKKALAGIAAALAKYPDGLVEKTLNAIYVPSRLTLAGDKAGGLADFDSRSVYIRGSEDFHHEFGHILHYSFWKLFPLKDWVALNGKEYTDDGRIVRTNHDPRQIYGSPYYHDKGFVNRYAMVSVFEDFAETFGLTFGHPEVMVRIQRNSEPVSKKIDLMVKFINDITKATSGRNGTLTRQALLTPQ